MTSPTCSPGAASPPCRPGGLALVTILQFREGLSDRRAADAVRARIDWKYLLGLELTDPGFDASVLCEFRARCSPAAPRSGCWRSCWTRCQDRGLLKARGRQRTDATHVLASIRVMNRLELLGETLRAALNELATVAPGWLRGWPRRRGTSATAAGSRTAACREPGRREAYARAVGEDGFILLDRLEAAGGRRRSSGSCRRSSCSARSGQRHFERERRLHRRRAAACG